jgi:hypothetical protein
VLLLANFLLFNNVCRFQEKVAFWVKTLVQTSFFDLVARSATTRLDISPENGGESYKKSLSLVNAN